MMLWSVKMCQIILGSSGEFIAYSAPMQFRIIVGIIKLFLRGRSIKTEKCLTSIKNIFIAKIKQKYVLTNTIFSYVYTGYPKII